MRELENFRNFLKEGFAIDGKGQLINTVVTETIDESIGDELFKSFADLVFGIVSSGLALVGMYLLSILWSGFAQYAKRYANNMKDLVNPSAFTKFTQALSKDKSFNRIFIKLLSKHSATKTANINKFLIEITNTPEFLDILNKYYPKDSVSNKVRNSVIGDFQITMEKTIRNNSDWIISKITKKYPELKKI